MLECALVGGGIHGTVLAQRLLQETRFDRSDIRILDPNERLLASFRRKAAACEMEAMRSTFVHHVGTEPFGLEDFAEARGREDELLPTREYPPRPSLALFLDYADDVIERRDLAALHRQAAVTGIQPRGDGQTGFVLETDAGESLATRRVVLAIGHGGRYRRPSWAEGVEGVTHVWDDEFDSRTDGESEDDNRNGDGDDDWSEGEDVNEAQGRTEDDRETVVVGGGITAVQLATCLAEHESVTLLSRDDPAVATAEADPRWINWGHVSRHLHRHPPGSKRRFEVVEDAHNAGTIPPRLSERLESLVDDGTMTHRIGDVRSARRVDGRVRLLLADGGCLTADRVALATGFEPVTEHPFVERVAAACDLERGYRGMPVLEDETLAWLGTDGDARELYVSGGLARGTAGPLAGTVVGARRAGDRIVRAIDTRTLVTAD
ncbi:FAD/NAD(P)-binding protein [Natrarchaeobaculum aegyptiacum]|uniref:Thioredoxin reductase n=1 Tax=Natrarchaeobaculum aegyptiacum TaxID=745377 RepID=A0A2Z2HQQ0_9EURY|nr:FAD/NAD(P)-binding protein [Natrarchaeobaculum aegyptiacum]ARS89369.1 thioredoxin reductase [Natrarchaeobaculum aegyptiacum]